MSRIQDSSLAITQEETGDNLSQDLIHKRLLRNAIFNSGGWAINVILTFLTTPFFVHKLTPEGYGIYALISSLIGYYSLLDLGLGQGLIKFVSENLAKKDYPYVYRAINTTLSIQICLGLIGLSILTLFAAPILRLLKVPPIYLFDAKIGLYASAVGFCFMMVSLGLSSILMGLQRYDITTKVNLIFNTLMLIVITLILFMGGGIGQVMIVTAIFAVSNFFVYLKIVQHNLPQWGFSLYPDWNLLRKLSSFSIFIFISRAASFFGEYIVRLIVGIILGPVGVTYYVVPWKIITAVGGLLSSAAVVLFPYASEIGVLSSGEKIRRIFMEASKVFAAIQFPLFLSLAVFSKPILTVWMGENFAEETWFVLSVLAFTASLGSISTIPNLFTMGLGYAKIITYFSIFTIVFYTITVPVFTHLVGVTGTAWAMLISSMPGLALVVYVLKNIFWINLWQYIQVVIKPHLIFLFISMVVIFAFRKTFLQPHIWTLALLPLFMGLYFSLMVLAGQIPLKKILKTFV